jgi:SAM-dependent methyltransferase
MKPVPLKRDAYGREIWAFHQGRGEPFEIVEREDGYVSAAPSTQGYFASFDAWPQRQREAIRLHRGGPALDVGCGAGRVALYFQERGIRVTAIDNSPLAIRTVRERGVRDARLLPFQNIDRLPAGRFATVVMFGNNFGLFGSYRNAKRLLRELYRITTPRAVLLAESVDPYRTENRTHLMYQRRNERRDRMAGQIRIRVRYRTYLGPWFDYLLVSPGEMKTIADGTGWAVERFITDGGPAYVGIIIKTDPRAPVVKR